MMMGLSDIVVALSRGAKRSDYYLFHPEYPLQIDMAVPPVSSSVQPQYLTTSVVKYLMKYVVKPPVQSSFTRGSAHVHMILDADYNEENDDTSTDDASSISSNDDDIPALVER